MNAANTRATRTVAMLLACSALAWLALVAVSASPWRGAFEHGALEHIGAHRWELSTLAAGWVLMVAAMMLPTTRPLVALFARLTVARPQHDESDDSGDDEQYDQRVHAVEPTRLRRAPRAYGSNAFEVDHAASGRVRRPPPNAAVSVTA